MRKIFIIISVIGTMSFSQAQSSKFGLGVDLFVPEIDPIEQYNQQFIFEGDHKSNGLGVQFTGTYALAKSFALALKVGRSKQTKTSDYEWEDQNSIPIWYNTEINCYHFYSGIEWADMTAKIQPYVGLGFQYILQPEYDEIQEMVLNGSQEMTSQSRFPSTNQYGVVGAMGLRYFVLTHFSIGIELNAAYIKEKSDGHILKRFQVDDDFAEMGEISINEWAFKKPTMFLRIQYWF